MSDPAPHKGLTSDLTSRSCDVEDLRAAWRDACSDLRVAYHAWREHGWRGGADAFAAYVAAADREAAAADVLARHALGRAVTA